MKADPVTGRRLGIGLAAVAVLLTSSCAAGQLAQTGDEKTTLDGNNASVGTMLIRGAVIEAPPGVPSYPPGADAEVKVVFVNSGPKDDALTGVSSPAARSWGAFATTTDADNQEAEDAASQSASAAPAPSAAAPASASPATSGQPSGKASSTPAIPAGSLTVVAPPSTLPPPQPPLTSVTIPAGNSLSYGTPSATGTLLLLHLTQRLWAGTQVNVTFTFRNAGSVTVVVPVGLSSSPSTQVVPTPSGSFASD